MLPVLSSGAATDQRLPPEARRLRLWSGPVLGPGRHGRDGERDLHRMRLRSELLRELAVAKHDVAKHNCYGEINLSSAKHEYGPLQQHAQHMTQHALC